MKEGVSLPPSEFTEGQYRSAAYEHLADRRRYAGKKGEIVGAVCTRHVCINACFFDILYLRHLNFSHSYAGPAAKSARLICLRPIRHLFFRSMNNTENGPSFAHKRDGNGIAVA